MMKTNKHDFLLRAAEGDLTPSEQERLGADARLRAEVRETARLRRMLRTGAAAPALSPFFVERVMTHLEHMADREVLMVRFMAGLFKRVAFAAVALTILISAYNLSSVEMTGQSFVEAALRLPPVNLEAAYDLEFVSLD